MRRLPPCHPEIQKGRLGRAALPIKEGRGGRTAGSFIKLRLRASRHYTLKTESKIGNALSLEMMEWRQ